jgi:WD40 repeat protein
MRGPWRKALLALLWLLSAATACLCVLAIVETVQSTLVFNTLFGLAGSILGLILTALTVRWHPSAQASIATLADDLAGNLAEEWNTEVNARGLRGSDILSVSWRPTGRGGPAGPALGGRLHGNFDEAAAQLARASRDVGSGRVMVLGDPGAGKTVLAMLLLIGLTSARRPGDRVPVLMSAASWDPLREDLDGWIVRLLSSHYGGDRDVPERLIAQSIVMPIIDGLDEIPESDRRAAIQRINMAVRHDGRPLVVTCRSVEYDDLITAGAPALHEAPVVEMEPLSAIAVATYLGAAARDWPSGTSWTTTLRAIIENPDSPLAMTLRTPLMVSMATLVYQRLGGDPTELLVTDLYGSRHAIEDHLMDRVVDAAYAPKYGPARSGRWSVDSARAYLTYLARYLHRYRERDLLWAQLSSRLASPWLAPLVGIGGGLVMMAVVATTTTSDSSSTGALTELEPANTILASSLDAGVIAGSAFAVLAMIMMYATKGDNPGRLAPTAHGAAERLRSGFIVGLRTFGLMSVAVLAPWAVTISLRSGWSLDAFVTYLAGLGGLLVGALALGCVLAVHSWLNGAPDRARKVGPSELMGHDRTSALIGALASALLTSGLALLSLIIGALLGVLGADEISSWPGWPGNNDATDELHALVTTIVRIFPNRWTLLWDAIVLPGLAIGSLVMLTRAWPRFVLIRVNLVVQRRLPFALPAFLRDARQRDILRQSGGAYQFRHGRLQERLALMDQAATTAYIATRGQTLAPRRWQYLRTAAVVALVAGAVGAVDVAAPVDLATYTFAGTYEQGPFTVTASNDGRLYAIFNANGVWLVDPEGFGPPVALSGVVSAVRAVRFSPDGRFVLVIAYDDSVVRTTMWDTDTGQRRFSSADNETVEFIDRGRELAVFPDDDISSSVDVRNPATGRPTCSITGFVPTSTSPGYEYPYDFDDVQSNPVVTVIRPSGRPQLWDLASCRQIPSGEPLRSEDMVFALGNGPDALTRHSGRTDLIDTAADRVVATLKGFDPTQEYGLAAHEHTLWNHGGDWLLLWDLRTGRPIRTPASRDDTINSFALSDDETKIAAETSRPGRPDGNIWILNAATGEQIVSFDDAAPNSTGLNFSADGRYFVYDREIDGNPIPTVWDLGAGRSGPYLSLANYSNESFESLSPIGDIMTTVDDNVYRAYDLGTGRQIAGPSKVAKLAACRLCSNGDATLIRFSPHRPDFLYADASGLSFWNDTEHRLIPIRGLPEGTIVETPQAIDAAPIGGSATFAPDGTTFTTCCSLQRSALDVWSADDGHHIVRLTGHIGSVLNFDYTADSALLVSEGEDGTVRLFRIPGQRHMSGP